NAPINALSVSARSEGIFVQAADSASFWSLHTEHPDISMKSAWGKVWYESYPEPSYTWQSTSGNADFEGKMSLMPLTFGTLKAAFYAMLLAAPLAILGAMYTAVFMSPALRTKVKPAIELMQALPTVILGFLAGLWLAPTLEANLPGIVSLLIITPIIILVCGFIWVQIPLEKRNRIPDGWAPVILIAPILLGGWISFASSQTIELQFFGGDIRHWLTYEAGITFDQRNSLIVGLAMGFAVIAPIFSIAEDALFAVPRHLTNGSLALGATQWQTLTRVILPTASPGIFSAVMIGFGRAVGETMIVLMATGNTAVMEWNIFEGMRTLSANVAVEMGEAEVGSTHFRILFLSALVLFVLTFILNTVAEVVRSRLRKKYGSL
ncbi:MAG TPA: ABC transporter permease subunit, partial [Agitococcus sp.]|nr:ABC transporter permease subunit [Agitococcus sp.]HNC03272.1 ABC transporter permease subunit [Agitococcus sp.]HNI62751.1 ABC transporter permease subunit [Agitococcus sp.]